jgi:hypothetical protein
MRPQLKASFEGQSFDSAGVHLGTKGPFRNIPAMGETPSRSLGVPDNRLLGLSPPCPTLGLRQQQTQPFPHGASARPADSRRCIGVSLVRPQRQSANVRRSAPPTLVGLRQICQRGVAPTRAIPCLISKASSTTMAAQGQSGDDDLQPCHERERRSGLVANSCVRLRRLIVLVVM